MKVTFEVGVEPKGKVVGKAPVVNKDDLEGLVVNPANDVKASLQKTLDDAGVKYNDRLGVAKLQLLVDGLSTDPVE